MFCKVKAGLGIEWRVRVAVQTVHLHVVGVQEGRDIACGLRSFGEEVGWSEEGKSPPDCCVDLTDRGLATSALPFTWSMKDMAHGDVICYYIRCLFPWRSCSSKTMKKTVNPWCWCVLVVRVGCCQEWLPWSSGISVPLKTQSTDDSSPHQGFLFSFSFSFSPRLS